MRNLIAALCGALAVVMLAAGPAYRAPHEAPLPPRPDSIPSALGWVPVHYVAGLTCDGQAVYGCYQPQLRLLSVRDSMNLATTWQTVRHEEFHMILADAGIWITTRGQEDLIADALGAQRVREMQAK